MDFGKRLPNVGSQGDRIFGPPGNSSSLSSARPSRVPATVLVSWGESWGVLRASWGRIGRILGPSWGRLGSLGASWERLGAVLRRLGDVLGCISLPIQLESDF